MAASMASMGSNSPPLPSPASLLNLDDDALFYIATFLSPVSILKLSNTCRSLRARRGALLQSLARTQPKVLHDLLREGCAGAHSLRRGRTFPSSLFLALFEALPDMGTEESADVLPLMFYNGDASVVEAALLCWGQAICTRPAAASARSRPSDPFSLLAGKHLMDTALQGRRACEATSLVRVLLTFAPWLATERLRNGATPLYEAVEWAVCQQAGALDLVRLLLHAAPEMASTPGESGCIPPVDEARTPLHRAVVLLTDGQACNVELVQMLLQAAPDAVLRPAGKLHSLPLHLAAQLIHGDDGARIVEALLAAAPETAASANADGWAALHLAAQWQGSGQILNMASFIAEATQALAFKGNRRLKPCSAQSGSSETETTPENQTRGMAVPRALLHLAPHVARQTVPETGHLPLHLVCEHQQGAEALLFVDALLAIAPEAVLMPNTKGFLPLHVAVRFQSGASGLRVVQRLLVAAPEAVHAADHTGITPLHLAAEAQWGEQGVSIIKTLLTVAGPDALLAETKGLLPLHCAVVSNKQCGNEDAAVVHALLQACPAAALKPSPTGWLPLHLAAEHQKGERGAAVAKALMRAAPEAVHHATDDGWFPLHLAVFFKCFDVALALLDNAPQAASLTMVKEGWVPLHVLVITKIEQTVTVQAAAVAVGKALLKCDPTCASVYAANGWLPIHAAAQMQERNRDMALLRLLLDAAPATENNLLCGVSKPQASYCEALQQTRNAAAEEALLGDRNGALPIHIAALGYEARVFFWDSTRSDQTVQELLRRQPDTARAAIGNKGVTPMHMAAFYDALHAAQALYRVDPGVIRVPTRDGYVALHLALAAGHTEMALWLFQMWPEAADVSAGAEQRLPFSYITVPQAAQALFSQAREETLTRAWQFTGLEEHDRQLLSQTPEPN